MSGKIFATPQDAEAAFYEALEHADLDAMMAVWAEDEEIVCVHPTGPRLAGLAAVRSSWERIFAGGPGARVRTSHRVEMTGMMVAVHSVHENFLVPGAKPPTATVVVTNVYLRSASGWRMIVHHASPAPGTATEAPRSEQPKILH